MSLTIVYIAGYGRSGSTILDTILGNEPGWFGAGELTHLFSDSPTNLCACGQGPSRCALWREVREETTAAHPDLSIQDCLRITRQVESLRSVAFHTRNRYADIWRTALSALSRISGSPVLVDSSKTVRSDLARPFTMSQVTDVFHVVHLLRHPLSVVQSATRGSNQSLAIGQPVAVAPHRTLYGWVGANLVAEVLSIRRSSTRLRYEDILADPGAALTRLERLTGRTLDIVRDKLASEIPLDPGHGLAGNRLRTRGPTILWQPDSTLPQMELASNWMTRILTPLMSRYDYT